MSAVGQKQTFAAQKSMSALPPKADMCGATKDVRFGPIADVSNSLDDFVGAWGQWRRHGQRKRLRDWSPTRILLASGPTSKSFRPK